ncbi:MAG: ribosome maturation factor RimP [Eubacterium sp.]|nr:ribosome maturation factor RimP [Eubacterium sp.]
MAKQNTVSEVEKLCAPIADEQGVELWDVRFQKEGTDWYLRVFIDKDGGVSIDDCVDFSRALSKVLDDNDPISQSYMLEVASPGVERELVRDSHFEKYIGSPIMMRTIRPIDNVRDFNGILTAYQDKQITVKLQDDSEITVSKKDTSYVKLDDFDINDFNQEI